MVLLLGSLFVWHRTLGSVSVSTVSSPKAEAFYWLTIMFSQTLGTALGDWTADTAGLGYTGAAVVFGALLALVVAAYYWTSVSRTLLFWAAFISVVKNLVDNAIRYTPEGGRVDLSVTVSDGKAELRIQDNGPGSPLAKRNRVFDPFYRTLGSEQIGSGLGLSIVQMIANRIGAEIRLDFSDQAKQTGLTVTVLFAVLASPLGI